jgi:hypothetical protein
MRLPRSLLSGFSSHFRRGRLFGRRLHFGHRALTGLCIAGSSWSCTLITDVDREKIPVPVQPSFPEVDAGPQPPLQVPDASLSDASAPGDAGDTDDASDAGGDPTDAAADASTADAG